MDVADVEDMVPGGPAVAFNTRRGAAGPDVPNGCVVCVTESNDTPAMPNGCGVVCVTESDDTPAMQKTVGTGCGVVVVVVGYTVAEGGMVVVVVGYTVAEGGVMGSGGDTREHRTV